ncbi:hypothetical protein [Laspinema olomoucense]|uniref:hypothetical protein n=1 Tax=Laspinema olomoucense TaxID=3231600 RepID=UPI0021BB15B2|nr:hypothetical protein [Laspinema sp. D3c]MCT7992452.1 hypothetical protein [Laspinema sp. D3c]
MTDSQNHEKTTKYQPIALAAISAFTGIATTLIATSPAIWGSDMDTLKKDIQKLESEKIELSKQIIELNSKNSEQLQSINELNKIVQNYQEITNSPDMAMMLLPYLLEAISLGPWDGTIDCGVRSGGSMKELACSQIQTLLYYLDSTKYKPEVPREEVRANLARYQRDEKLSFAQNERNVGMLDQETLTRLIQQRLDDTNQSKKACEFFPKGC